MDPTTRAVRGSKPNVPDFVWVDEVSVVLNSVGIGFLLCIQSLGTHACSFIQDFLVISMAYLQPQTCTAN
jgi:hypothetical protein